MMKGRVIVEEKIKMLLKIKERPDLIYDWPNDKLLKLEILCEEIIKQNNIKILELEKAKKKRKV